MTRGATSVILGALVAVVAWTAWSTLGLREASESALPVDTAVVDAAPPSTGPPRPTPAAIAPPPLASAIAAPAAPPATAAAPPPLRDGLVQDHGMPMAVHALAGDGAPQALPTSAATLPAGALPDDAVVNGAGMVTLTRSTETHATADATAANAQRPVVATHAP